LLKPESPVCITLEVERENEIKELKAIAVHSTTSKTGISKKHMATEEEVQLRNLLLYRQDK